MVNRLSQTDFEARPFDSAGFNLHTRPEAGSRPLVVLVHGFGGRGYGTWRDVPARLFNGAEGPPTDVGIYDYRSAQRRLRGGTAEMSFWVRQLHDHIRDVESEYSDIFLIGHSLGGVLIEAVAMRYMNTRAMESNRGKLPLAALILLAAPRAGSGWAAPVLQWFIPEIRHLRRLSWRGAEVDRFFTSYIERHNVTVALPGRTVLPMYAVLGSQDWLVSEFSAAFGIPERQQLLLSANHFSLVKPRAHDTELMEWLRRIIDDRQGVRIQAAREQGHADQRPAIGVGQPRTDVVTQFWSDPTGLQWEELYNEARQAATTPAVTVHDAREALTDEVDLLMAVHDAELVLAQSPEVRTTVDGACAMRAQRPSLSVGISPVGQEFPTAEATIHGWLVDIEPGASLYVTGAADADGLRRVLARWLQLVINRDPRRRTDALSDFDFSSRSPLLHYPESDTP